MSLKTLTKAVGEVEAGIEPSDRLRAPGAGDKPAIDKQPGLLEALDALVHPDTRGNPMSALRWTVKSTYTLQGEERNAVDFHCNQYDCQHDPEEQHWRHIWFNPTTMQASRGRASRRRIHVVIGALRF